MDKSVHGHVPLNDYDAVRSKLATSDAKELLLRNRSQTPLSVAICLNATQSISALLDSGAASSVFVKGYSPQSLVCTLPMAHQPPSSVFAHPPPLKGVDPSILAHIDEALSSHVHALANAARHQPSSDPLGKVSASIVPVGAGTDPAPQGPPTTTTKTAFDHFPAALQPGDLVRRGPNWRWGSQDGSRGCQYVGKVLSVNGVAVDVEWSSDASKFESSGNSNTYSYNPTAKDFGLCLIDPANPLSVPPNVPGIILPPAPHQPLRIGDLVQLSGLAAQDSSQSGCGVVLRLGPPQAPTQHRQFPSAGAQPANHPSLRILHLASGAEVRCSSEDVDFADGSPQGPLPRFMATPRPIGPASDRSTATLVVGDIVRLAPSSTEENGCLGRRSAGLLGRIGLVQGTSIVVERGAQASSLQHVYQVRSLVPAYDVSTPLPLQAGDRVELAPSALAAGVDGWCLSSPPRPGVVIFAPASDTPEQRQIAVAACDNSAATYLFRSTWLQRTASAGTHAFAVGDRVQLDVAKWVAGMPETSGKCLGNPSASAYGIICSLGPTRNGIQRNIEVHAVTGPRAGQWSLYPGYVLVPAVRHAVMTATDLASLLESATRLIASSPLASSLQALDLPTLLPPFGLQAWDRVRTLMEAAQTSGDVVAAFHAWQANRMSDWPLDEEMAVAIAHQNPDDPAVPVSAGGIACASAFRPPPDPVLPLWTCVRCKFDANRGRACVGCTAVPAQWTCGLCSAANHVLQARCVACYTDRPSSQAKQAERLEAKRARARAEREAAAAAAAAKLLEQESADGSFAHPGTFEGCGGNPEGFCMSEGDGKCSSQCIRCGRNTHWSCCASTDAASPNCQPGISQAQATRNAAILAAAATTKRRPVDIAGYELPGVVAENWSCSGCTFLNPLTAKTCSICQEKKPAPVKAPSASATGDATAPSSTQSDRLVVSTYLTRLSAACLESDMASAVEQLSPRSSDVLHSFLCNVCGSSNFGKSKNPASAAQASGVDVPGDDFGSECSLCGQDLESAEPLSASLSGASNPPFGGPFGLHRHRTSARMRARSRSRSPSRSRSRSPSPSSKSAPTYLVCQGCGQFKVCASCCAGPSDADPDTEFLSTVAAPLPADLEQVANSALKEKYFLTSLTEPNPAEPEAGPMNDDLEPVPVMRATSVAFSAQEHYEAISSIADLCTFRDKAGNGAAHHAAAIGLPRTVSALLAAGAVLWATNNSGDTVAGLLAGLGLGAGAARNTLHKALALHDLVPAGLMPAALRTPAQYQAPAELKDLLDAMLQHDENAAEQLSLAALEHGMPHAMLYRALFLMWFDYGTKQVMPCLESYENSIRTSASAVLDPLYYLMRYLLWRRVPLPSYAVRDRLLAGDALTALRYFPHVASLWLQESDDIDKQCAELGLDAVAAAAEEEDEDYSALIPPPGPDDPESLWELEKKNHGVTSPSMDKLMALTGLRQVKRAAMQVATEVLLSPPADLDSSTSMNLMFVGNPGSGKTTVATLLAEAMVELKYRSNPTAVMTSAGDILAAKDPAAEFADNLKSAIGGTLFIDEAYLFDPAPKGSRANDSNRVLDMLMQACIKHKETTTFILAGYKEEMMQLLQYNIGFPSRFPKEFTFEFEDFTEAQLCKILCDMAKAKGYRFETRKECGVPIARVLSRRMFRGSNCKGFGNGRVVEKVLEKCQKEQKARLGRLKLYNIQLTPRDYKTLLRGDTVGDRPRLEESPHFRELNAMVGLARVKLTMANFMQLQLQNYDAEMRGEPVQTISLHRLFVGSPGTGKTTVAKLYGRMLKEFGFLSDGDFIMVTPSDLKGQAQGEAAARTKALLDGAKGKVVFIDEAYNLDPSRNGNTFGAEVIDTLVEKIEGAAGSDMCVVLAGYQGPIEEMFRKCNNPGLKRRFNVEEAFVFEDFSDEDIKKVLKALVVSRGLSVAPDTLDFAVKQISRRRKLDDFGNAAEASSILDRAKLRLTARKSASQLPASELSLLLPADFVGEETSADKAHEAFAGMENMEPVIELLQSLESTVLMAKQDGKDPADILCDMHMILTGPPGTGKTTCAKRLGVMLRNLDLLPRGHVEVVTAANLISRYMGNTGPNVVEAMRRAKGGILFIDEAYGMLPRHGSYGGEAIQALLDNITMAEFKGRLVVVLAGYRHQVEELFDVNPGFQSRFDKVRIAFNAWTGPMAARATIRAIEQSGKVLTAEAAGLLPHYYAVLSLMPNWGSAREVFEIVLPALYQRRAVRCQKDARDKRLLTEAGPARHPPGPPPPPPPYEAEDVRLVFSDLISRRGGSALGDVLGADPHQNADPPTTLSADAAAAGAAPAPMATPSTKLLRQIDTTQELQQALHSAAQAGRLMVVYLHATWSPMCASFLARLATLASQFSRVLFYLVDYDSAKDIDARLDGTAAPLLKLFVNGAVAGEVSGSDGDVLAASLRFKILESLQQISVAEDSKSATSVQGRTGATAGDTATASVTAPKAAIKVTVAPPVALKKRADDDEDDSRQPSEQELWAALEQACRTLGYTLDALKAMLESPDFPPTDVLDLVMAQTGASDAAAVRAMLGRQRAAVLQKVTKAILEAARAKSAQEAAQLECAKVLGKCPMGFEWIRTEGGFRCAGGSHFVSEADVNCHMQNKL